MAKVIIEEKNIQDWQTEVFLRNVIDHMENNVKRKPLNLSDKPKPQDEFKIGPVEERYRSPRKLQSATSSNKKK